MTDKEILNNLYRLPFVAVCETHPFFPDFTQRFLLIPKKAVNKGENGTEKLLISLEMFLKLKEDEDNIVYVKKGITFIEPKNIEKQMKTYIKEHRTNPHE